MATVVHERQRPRGAKRTHRTVWFPYWFLLPASVIFVVLMAIPMIGSIVLSLDAWNGLGSPTWVGLENYWNLVQDPNFLVALGNTAYFTIATVIIQTVFPLLVAILVNSGIRGSMVFRAIYFMPVIISLAITGMLWSIIYEPTFGVLNTVLTDVGLHGLTRFWLADKATVMPSIIGVSVWQSMGFYLVIFFAGLQNIPKDLYEAAAMDGANAWQRLMRVTVPLLAPVTTVVVVLNTVNGLKVFDQVWVMTAGGPDHASETLGTYLYTIAFGAQGSANPELGYASAIGIVILILALILSFFQVRWGQAGEIEY